MRAVVTVRTLDHSVHSGMYGGAAPDAVTALVRLLASLHDDEGNVAVAGLKSSEAADLDYDEASFRAESGLLDGVSLIGSGSILSRLWTRPALTTIGIDVTSVDKASNTLAASARAKVSMRVAPDAGPGRRVRAAPRAPARPRPWGAQVEVDLEEHGPGFAADADGPVYDAARSAFADAWGTDPVDIGVGGSIPFVASFAEKFPDAAILVTGVEDPDIAGPRRQRVPRPRRVRAGLHRRGDVPRADGRPARLSAPTHPNATKRTRSPSARGIPGCVGSVLVGRARAARASGRGRLRAQCATVGVDGDRVDDPALDERLERPHEVRQVDPVHRRAVADVLLQEGDLLLGEHLAEPAHEVELGADDPRRAGRGGARPSG